MCVMNIFQEIEKYTLQIFHICGFADVTTARIEPFASGVLVTYNHNFYLFSAGHVFAGVDVNELGFLQSNYDLAQIDGRIIYIDPDKNSQINNIGDIAVVRLTELAVKDILSAGHSFYPLGKNNLSHNLRINQNYAIMGYPVSRTKPVRKNPNTIKIKPLQLITSPEINQKTYAKNGFDIDRNLIFKFSRNKLLNNTGHKVSAPLPYGISGCGVWCFDQNTLITLIGIMFRWNQGDSILIGAKLDFPMEIIRQFIDSTIPQSPVVYNFKP